MKNPFKRVTAYFNKKAVGTVDPSSADYKRLRQIWPDGTWQKSDTNPKMQKDYDLVACATIFDAWWLEDFGGDMKIFKTKNPGMMGLPSPIPSDWLPSERIYKEVARAKDHDPKFVHYVIGELSNLKHLRP